MDETWAIGDYTSFKNFGCDCKEDGAVAKRCVALFKMRNTWACLNINEKDHIEEE